MARNTGQAHPMVVGRNEGLNGCAGIRRGLRRDFNLSSAVRMREPVSEPSAWVACGAPGAATLAVSTNRRKARFTDSVSGKTSASSGSTNTRFVPAVACRKYLPRTPPFNRERSYSGRKSSPVLFADAFFISKCGSGLAITRMPFRSYGPGLKRHGGTHLARCGCPTLSLRS